MSPWICREGGCVPASHQLSFVPENITKYLYHSVLDTQSQVTYTTLERFLVLFLTTQSPLSAWIKNAALGCSGGRCLHVSCALLCRKFAKKKKINVKQQGCAVATASWSLVPCTLGVPVVEGALPA